MGRIISIPNVDGPLITQGDYEDIPLGACVDTKNFEIDKPGLIYKRQGRKTIATLSSRQFSQVLKWSNSNLIATITGTTIAFNDNDPSADTITDSGNGFLTAGFVAGMSITVSGSASNDGTYTIDTVTAGTITLIASDALTTEAASASVTVVAHSDGTAWIAYDQTDDKILIYDKDWKGERTLKTLSGGISDIKILNFADQLRFANTNDAKAGIYQFINREFFFGNWQPTDGFLYDDAAPSYPSTWDYKSISDFSAGGSNKIGHHYYKFVPVFDGNQEWIFSSAHLYLNLATDDEVIKTKIDFDTDDFNKRITAIKVYRSYSPENTSPSYYHIKTIPVNTTSSHSDISSAVTRNIAFCVYDPEKSWTINEHASRYARIQNTDYEIDSNTADTLLLKTAGGNPGPVAFNSVDGTGLYDINTGTGGSGTVEANNTGYYGKRVIYDDTWDFALAERANWIAKITGGQDDIIVTDSYGKVVIIRADSTATGSSVTVAITNGYRYSISGSVVSLFFYDHGYTDGDAHPLDGVEKATVNYDYGVYIDGRLYPLSVKLDPDGDAEEHRTWIMFSELFWPDITNITSYIILRDLQGGDIKGGGAILGDLVALMERGIYRLRIPSNDPTQWELVESEENIGCIAPNSVVQIGNVMFFAGKDHFYLLSQDFEAIPVTRTIRDDYQGKANLQNSRAIYDVNKERLLCRFGDDNQNIYALDLKSLFGKGNEKWNIINVGTAYADLFAIDENLVVYSINTAGSAASIVSELYPSSGGTESLVASRKFGWIRLTDLARKAIIRRLGIRYLSTDAITAKIYADGDDSTEVKSLTFPANNVSGDKYASYRGESRARFVMIELSVPSTSTYNTTIEHLEIEVDE